MGLFAPSLDGAGTIRRLANYTAWKEVGKDANDVDHRCGSRGEQDQCVICPKKVGSSM